MTKILPVLSQDLKACFKAFMKNRFELANIYANRLMANLIFEDNYKLFLPGFFAKEISLSFANLQIQKDRPLETAKIGAEKFFDFLISNFNENLDELKLWNRYFEYFRTRSELLNDEIDKEIYTKNLEFTEMSFSRLLIFLDKERETLLDLNNNFLAGLLNEMNRILRNHSGTLKEFLIFSYLIIVRRYYVYALITNIENNILKKEEVKSRIFPYIDYITKEFPNNPLNIVIFDEKLADIIKKWREYFILYTELRPPQSSISVEKPKQEPEKKVELSPEMKDALSNGISKILEKKME